MPIIIGIVPSILLLFDFLLFDFDFAFYYFQIERL